MSLSDADERDRGIDHAYRKLVEDADLMLFLGNFARQHPAAINSVIGEILNRVNQNVSSFASLRSSDEKAMDKIYFEETGSPRRKSLGVFTQWFRTHRANGNGDVEFVPLDGIDQEDKPVSSTNDDKDSHSNSNGDDDDEEEEEFVPPPPVPSEESANEDESVGSDGFSGDGNSQLTLGSSIVNHIQDKETAYMLDRYFGEMACAKANFLSRLEKESKEEKDGSSSSMKLMVGKVDVYTPMATAILGDYSGDQMAGHVEYMASLFFQLLSTTMTAAAQAKAVATAAVNEQFAHVDVDDSPPLAIILWEFNDNRRRAVSEVDEDFQSAAKAANRKIPGRKNWKTISKLPQKVKVILGKTACHVTVMRALRIAEHSYILDLAVENNLLSEKERANISSFIGEFIPGHVSRDYSLKAIEIFFHVLVPATRLDAPIHHQKLGRSLARHMMTVLGYDEFRPIFAQAEAVPITRMISECSDVELAQYVARMQSGNPYLSGAGDLQQTHRKESLRGAFYPLLLETVAHTLVENQMFTSHDVEMLPLGLICTAPSGFRYSTYNILYDSRLHEPTDENDKDTKKYLLEKKKDIANLVSAAKTAIEVFQETYVWVDLTADLANRTRVNLESFSTYLNA